MQHYDSESIGNILHDKSLGLLSKKGAIHIDKKQHLLWVHDDKKHIHTILQWIKKLSHPKKQILLYACIASIDTHYMQSVGMLLSGKLHEKKHNTTANSNSQLTFPVALLNNTLTLDAKLSALQQQGHAHIISKPELVVLNHCKATIESGDEIPYQETTNNGNVNVSFKKAVLKLTITPDINSTNTILLSLSINQDKVSPLTIKGVPAIHTRHVSTEVRMHDGQTLILGGIIENKQSNQTAGIPLLTDIPLIGKLFEHKQQHQEKKELFIFIKPKIVST